MGVNRNNLKKVSMHGIFDNVSLYNVQVVSDMYSTSQCQYPRRPLDTNPYLTPIRGSSSKRERDLRTAVLTRGYSYNRTQQQSNKSDQKLWLHDFKRIKMEGMILSNWQNLSLRKLLNQYYLSQCNNGVNANSTSVSVRPRGHFSDIHEALLRSCGHSMWPKSRQGYHRERFLHGPPHHVPRTDNVEFVAHEHQRQVARSIPTATPCIILLAHGIETPTVYNNHA